MCLQNQKKKKKDNKDDKEIEVVNMAIIKEKEEMRNLHNLKKEIRFSREVVEEEDFHQIYMLIRLIMLYFMI